MENLDLEFQDVKFVTPEPYPSATPLQVFVIGAGNELATNFPASTAIPLPV